MSGYTFSQSRIAAFFSDKLNLCVPSADTDLVQAKFLDSLALVELLTYLEQEFRIELTLDGADMDDFRTIAKIAEFVDLCSGGSENGFKAFSV